MFPRTSEPLSKKNAQRAEIPARLYCLWVIVLIMLSGVILLADHLAHLNIRRKLVREEAQLNVYMSDWKRDQAIWKSPHQLGRGDEGPLVAPVRKQAEELHLWKQLGTFGSEYSKRSALVAAVLGQLSPKRVFEFSIGDGALFAKVAFQDQSVRSSVRQWVHAEASRPALLYAALALGSESLSTDSGLDLDTALLGQPAGKDLQLPWKRMAHIESHLVAVEIVEVDMANPTRLVKAADLSRFDTFVSASFGEFVDDLEILAALPPHGKFVFCVPNFDHASHVRSFQNEVQIRQRYGSALEINSVRAIQTQGAKYGFFIVSGDVKEQP